MDDRRIELTEGLNRNLEAVLAAFESPASESGEGQMQAWADCEAAFASCREECERCEGVPAPEGLHEIVQQALKLHAIAISVVGREQDWLREEISKLGDTRTRLRAFASPPRVGDSCDIQG